MSTIKIKTKKVFKSKAHYKTSMKNKTSLCTNIIFVNC